MRTSALCLLLVMACDSGGDEPGGVCATRGGFYRVNYQLRSGTCGPLPETVINLDAPIDATCVARTPADRVSCEVYSDATCTTPDGAQQITVKGKVTWTADASRGTGLLQFVSTGALVCSGTYDVTYTKL